MWIFVALIFQFVCRASGYSQPGAVLSFLLSKFEKVINKHSL